MRHCRGKIQCVYGTGKHLWTAGEKSVREWHSSTGENVRTWSSTGEDESSSYDMASAMAWGASLMSEPDPAEKITCIILIAGRLWCGRADGGLTVYDQHTGAQVAALSLFSEEPVGGVASIQGSVWVTAATGDRRHAGAHIERPDELGREQYSISDLTSEFGCTARALRFYEDAASRCIGLNPSGLWLIFVLTGFMIAGSLSHDRR